LTSLVIPGTDTHCCRKGPLIIIWRQSVCVCFGLVGSRPGPVTAAALYAMMGRAAAAGGDGSYSSRSARRGAGGGAAGRGESVRQRGGMGRASVPGPSMAAERGGAGRGVARPPAQCEAARRGGAGEVEERASPLRARPSATPHASVGPAAHVRQRSARPSAAVVTRRTDRWPGPGTVARRTVGRCGWRAGDGQPGRSWLTVGLVWPACLGQ
jgi:hypothetical protein